MSGTTSVSGMSFLSTGSKSMSRRRVEPSARNWICTFRGSKNGAEASATSFRKASSCWLQRAAKAASPRAPIFECFRRHAWFGEAFGLSGNQFFLLHDAQGGVGERDWKAPTEGGIVYRSFDDFIPSVRYMNFRRGVNDVKYLAKLRELAGGDPEVRAFLRAAAQRVVETGRIDRTAADRVREEVAARILRVSH